MQVAFYRIYHETIKILLYEFGWDESCLPIILTHNPIVLEDSL